MCTKKYKLAQLLSKHKIGFRITAMVAVFALLIFSWSCNKDDYPEFSAGFSTSFLDDNTVQFTNTSDGDYYSLIWDFGNGQVDTTTDKSKTQIIYYPAAGDFTASLKVLNYYGEKKSSSKSISIANTDFEVSFTMEVDAANPNYVKLVNTTQGNYDSIRWEYRNKVVENQNEHTAYFPFAGNYDVKLFVKVYDYEFSQAQSVAIEEDDPNYEPEPIWSEEFDYEGVPDPLKWSYETGGSGWGNNELQYYTDSTGNSYVSDGVLTITAMEQELGGRDYTSARITTQNKFDFKYGRAEASIKMPYGQGMWPAFWMLGASYSTVGWPACGEIDITEMVGGDDNGDNTTYSTLHWDNDGEHAEYGESFTLTSGNLSDDFHVYAVEWDEQKIVGLIDDIQYYEIDITPDELSEFHADFFIILNLAVGGDWPGPPDATTVFPQTMEVDYIRVYQND